MSGRPSPFVSMSAALSMPFDELSDLVRNGSSNPSAIRPDQVRGGSTSAVAASTSYRDSVPNASQELVVYVSTDNQRKRETIEALLRKQKGGNESIRVLDLKQRKHVLKGKDDFILFDSLEDSFAKGEVIVIACDKNDKTFKTAQGYLLQSISRWFMQKKVDGAGEEYDETKNFDPVTKKVFTRDQILHLLELYQHLCREH